MGPSRTQPLRRLASQPLGQFCIEKKDRKKRNRHMCLLCLLWFLLS
jgi:hypothetical protein